MPATPGDMPRAGQPLVRETAGAPGYDIEAALFEDPDDQLRLLSPLRERARRLDWMSGTRGAGVRDGRVSAAILPGIEGQHGTLMPGDLLGLAM